MSLKILLVLDSYLSSHSNFSTFIRWSLFIRCPIEHEFSDNILCFFPTLFEFPQKVLRHPATQRRLSEGGQPLPSPRVPSRSSFHGRLLALPSAMSPLSPRSRGACAPTVAVTEAASGIDPDVGLRPALEAKVVELDHDRIRFTHPLLAAGAYEHRRARPARQVHARLAELLEDPEARAWQLAASVESPDESAAKVLEEASQHARDRGALRPAALMLERASALTPSDRPGEALQRAVDAAYLHFASGDSRRAEAQLRALIAPLRAGVQRARATVILGADPAVRGARRGCGALRPGDRRGARRSQDARSRPRGRSSVPSLGCSRVSARFSTTPRSLSPSPTR